MLATSPKELQDWINTAKPGDVLAYYRGDLAADPALTQPTMLQLVNAIARHAVGEGRFDFLQRRLGVDAREYLIRRRRLPRAAPVPRERRRKKLKL